MPEIITPYYYCNEPDFEVKSSKFNESYCYKVDYNVIYGHNISDLEYILCGVLLPIIGVWGVIGNILGIIDFGACHERQEGSILNTFYSLMLALSVSDLVTILSTIGSNISVICTKLLNPDVFMENWIFAYIQYFSSLSNKIHIITGVYLMVSLCFERHSAICRPFSSRFAGKQASSYILPVLCCSVLLNVPQLFSLTVGTTKIEKWAKLNESMKFIESTEIYQLDETRLFQSIVYFRVVLVVKLILTFFIPSICLISLNTRIVKAIKDRKYNLVTRSELATEKEEKSFQMLSLSQPVGNDSMYIHISQSELHAREKQVNLAIVNLVIDIALLITHSFITVPTVYILLIDRLSEIKVSLIMTYCTNFS